MFAGFRFRTLILAALISISSVVAVAAPGIASISPTVGPVSPVGSAITITGTGFGATQDTSSITIGGVASAPTSWSDSRIVAPVPSSLLPGFADVVVTVAGVSSNAQSFLVIPVITAASPATAPVGGPVTITGTSFGDTQGSSTVTFNGVPAVPSTWSNTSITFPIPVGASSGAIVVTINGFETNGDPYPVSPAIASLSPASGSVSSTLTINGSGFGAAQNFNPVTIGGVSVTPSFWSDTSIQVPVDTSLPAGTASVVVTVNAIASNAASFLVTPSITALSANSGLVGDSITIAGTSFGGTQGASSISFNGLAATPSVWTDTSITVPVPTGASTGPVLVTVNGVSSNLVGFTVLVPPSITSLSVNSGFAGTRITITGSNFGATQGSGTVQIGGQPMIVSSWSDSSIDVVVPAEALTGDIVVTSGVGLASNPVTFTVNFGGPVLQVAVSDAPLQVNLTSPQTLDWIHWGRISETLPDRKNGIAPLISDYTLINSTQAQVFPENIAFSWSDGNHPPVVSETFADVETYDPGSGFQITVPADTTVKTLNLYAEVFSGQAILHASLSDGSAADITDQSVTDSDVGSKVYSIDFRAASPGQTLTVTFTGAAGAGGVGLQAATLTPHLPVVNITSPIAAQSYPAGSPIPLTVAVSQLDSSISALAALATDGSSFTATSAPLSANWQPASSGHYVVNANALDTTGLTNAAPPVEVDVVGQGGTLSVLRADAPSFIDLSVTGTADWVLWGPLNTGDFIINNPGNVLGRKTGVAPLITDYRPIGNHFMNPRALANGISFSDSSQNFFSSGSQLQVFGRTDGYEISAPADTTTRTLQLYVGAVLARGKLSAFLSDGSAVVVNDLSFDDPNGPDFSGFGAQSVYSITYSAASAGQTLTVRYTMDFDYGNGQVALLGAALDGSPVTPTVPTPQIASINPSIAPSNTQVTLTGTSFGATQGNSSVFFGNLSPQIVSWSDSSILVIVPADIAEGSTVPVMVFTAGGASNEAGFTTPSYTLNPPSLSLVVGQSASITPRDSSGNPVTGLAWTTSDTSILSLSSDDPPVMLAIAPGTATVFAGGVPATVTVSLTPPSLISLSVGPQSSQISLGLTQQLYATGVYADGSTQDVTAAVTWNSLTPSIANISSQGHVSGIQPGLATIQASMGSVVGSATLSIQPASLSAIIITPAIPAATVGGTEPFHATGVFTDGTTQDISSSVSWTSSNTTIATIDTTGLATGISSGSTLILATQGRTTSAVTLEVSGTAALPSITAEVSPPPNSSGWNNLTAIVTFRCTPGGSAIVTCPAPQTVSTEGIGQVFSGTVTDAAGNTATASITLNVDRTTPALVVSSVADGAVLSTPNLTVSGNVSDSLSGLDTLTCNGSAAVLSGPNFSCDVLLNPGLNLLLVRATDLAGNVTPSIMHVTLSAPLPPPQSLQITPANVNLLIGDTQQFTVVDEQGRPRPDAVWIISDSSLATLSTDTFPILTAVQLGRPVLTAQVGSVSVQLTVNIVTGGTDGTLPAGTARWSISPTPGFTAQEVISAEPADAAPDLYALESDSSANLNVRALTLDGQQLWSRQMPMPSQGPIFMIGDQNGGVLLRTTDGIQEIMTDLDPQTGSDLWSYSFTGLNPNGTQPAVADDGTVYFWRMEGHLSLDSVPPARASLMARNGLSGSAIASYPIPLGKSINSLGQNVGLNPAKIADPVIDEDGTVWAPYEVLNEVGEAAVETMSLLKVTGGAASTISYKTTSFNFPEEDLGAPLEIIPNGQGGALVSWEEDTGSTLPLNSVYHVSNVSSDGATVTFTSQKSLASMVLGENGIAFVDGSVATAFNINSGQQVWTYPQATFSLRPLSGNGLLVNTAAASVALDSTGLPVFSGSLLNADPIGLTTWEGVLNNSFALFAGPSAASSSSSYQHPKGNRKHQRRAQCTLTVHSDIPLSDVAKQDGILRAFASVPDVALSFVTGTADLTVSNSTDLPPRTLGRDGNLTNHALISTLNIFNVKPQGTAQVQVDIATGTIIAHEFGHYLLQCIHLAGAPNDCGNVGLMKPGTMHGDELWHIDFGLGNVFTKDQAKAIYQKCKQLHLRH